jgi:hypothetical protein
MHPGIPATTAIVSALAACLVWYGGRALLRGRLQTTGTAHRTMARQATPMEIDEVLTGMSARGSADASQATIVKAWAGGRVCVSCGGALVESRFAGHHIALLDPGGTTREWVDVAADRLPLALATSLPVCWNCHIAATFRRMHPELVTDRDWELKFKT